MRFHARKAAVPLMLIALSAGAARAQDFRQVLFGNNYERIGRVTNEDVLSALKEKIEPVVRAYTARDDRAPRVLSVTAIFEEKYINGKIYRVIAADHDYGAKLLGEEKSESERTEGRSLFARLRSAIKREAFGVPMQNVFQLVFVETEKGLRCLCAEPFRYWNSDGNEWFFCENSFSSVEIISRDGMINGILLHTTSETESHIGPKRTAERKSRAWFMEFGTAFLYGDSLEMDIKKDCDAEIEGSFALIDRKRPFLYTIQNAFDGNPATSFIEDTDDDMMEISVSVKSPSSETDRIRIVNGYAQTEKLYKANNRIARISSGAKAEFTCADGKTEAQESPWDKSALTVLSIHKGSSFSDTCLAELDFRTKGGKWIFGEN